MPRRTALGRRSETTEPESGDHDMKLKGEWGVVHGVVSGLVAFTAHAGYVDITINDTVNNGSSSGWYRGTTGVAENDEVEPGTVTGQVWDMEAFLLDFANAKLKVQAGYNMTAGYGGYYSGDIFIDVNGDARWGNAITTDASSGTSNGYFTVANSQYNWDYVISFGRNSGGGAGQGGGSLTGGYEVYKLSGTSSEVEVYYDLNNRSNPLRYLSGGTLVTTGGGLTQASTGSGSTLSYTLGEIDLGWMDGKLIADQPVTFHYTMGCGNDLLMGQAANFHVPDGGASVGLLGLGLAALGVSTGRLRRSS